MNPEYTYERPVDTAVNIQWGRPSSHISVGEPRSISSFPMDSFLLSKIDYTKYV